MFIIPRWRGKQFHSKKISKGGGQKRRIELQKAQMSNLRGEAANWKQQKMIRITTVDNIFTKTKNEEIASSPINRGS